MPTDKLLELEGLTKYFYKPMGLLGRRKQVVQSVDHVSFHILRHETFGLVGESGCGKSTLGRTITRLYEPTEGKILYDGTDISHLTGPQLLPYRKRIQMIFQDPYASLDSRMTVMDIIREALDLHSELTTKEQRSQRVYELLDHVGLMREHANRYPHEFSGGQRQRIGIARALAVNPEFIVCDEPISALDVSIQAQVVNMLEDLQRELGPDVPVYRPRPVRGAPYLQPHRRHVPGQAGGGGRQRGNLPEPSPPLHRGPALRRARPRPGARPPGASASCCRGTFPAPSIPLPAAGSAPAALTPRSCAPSRSRR